MPYSLRIVCGFFNVYLEEMLCAVRCFKSNEDMILALAGQFKELSHEPEKYREIMPICWNHAFGAHA